MRRKSRAQHSSRKCAFLCQLLHGTGGAFHTENGSYMDYFMPHIGLPALRRGGEHRSILDRYEIMLSHGYIFYDADAGEEYFFDGIRMEKTYENDLPIFVLSGKNENGSFRLVMKAYSKAHCRIEQPLLKIFSTIFHYNIYPAKIVLRATLAL